MNFAKFLRAPFLQNTAGQLLLIIREYFYKTQRLIKKIQNSNFSTGEYIPIA